MPLIAANWESEMYKYLAGIIKNHGGEPIEINGLPDHVHVFARLGPVQGFSTFLRELKASSSKWAKQHEPKFGWQRRYGAFTVSESAADAVRRYIRDQKRRHASQGFEDEYRELLRLHNVKFDEKYLWD
jgi:putative transposase